MIPKKRLKRRTCEHYTQLNVVSLYRKSLEEGVNIEELCTTVSITNCLVVIYYLYSIF